VYYIFGYGVLNASVKSNPKRSIVYKNLCNRFIPSENIYIDLLENEKSERKDLHKIYARAEEIRNDDKDAFIMILILNRHTLGSTESFKKLWKKIVIEKKLNLLIVDDTQESGCDYYSSTDFSLIRKSENEIKEILKTLQKAKFERVSDKTGRKAATITDRFVTAYWAFQEFKVTPEEAIEYANVSKTTFYSLCKKYEASENYESDLQKHWDVVADLPRRGSVPSEMVKVIFDVESRGIDIEEALKSHKIEIPVIDYERYFKAYNTKRKTKVYEEALYIPDYFKTINPYKDNAVVN